MARVLDLLDRFRPAGAPGPAGLAGVPVDRRESAAVELAPVFGLLAEVGAECDRLRHAATQAAAQREAAATEQARVWVARARTEAAALRAATAARIGEDTAAELAQLAGRTAAEAEEVRRRGAQRLPQLLSLVVERVHADLAAVGGELDGTVGGELDRAVGSVLAGAAGGVPAGTAGGAVSGTVAEEPR